MRFIFENRVIPHLFHFLRLEHAFESYILLFLFIGTNQTIYILFLDIIQILQVT